MLSTRVVGAAQVGAPAAGLTPSVTRSRTCTSSPRCAPSSAASSPIGPAPVTSTFCGSNQAREPMRLDVLPGLGHHGGGLHQHAELAQRGVDLDRVVGLDDPLLAAVAVQLLDAALGVLAVAAHVELAPGAGAAGHGVGPADHAHHQVAGGEARSPSGACEHPPERLVAEDHAARSGGPAVLPGVQLPVGPADAQGQTLDEQLTRPGLRLRHLGHPERALFAGNQRDRTHGLTSEGTTTRTALGK